MASTIFAYPMNNSAILRIYYDRNLINPLPDYQRQGEIWSLEKKQLLIDSILNEYDIPKIYFHALSRPKVMDIGKEVVFAIIDGKQRIQTIWDFVDNKFGLSEDFVYFKNPEVKAGGMTYKELANNYPKLKVMFDSFSIPIICVETDDIELIEDMFSRLNEAVPLNSAEKRNAIGGPMSRLINDISAHNFFMNKVRFSNKRYQFKESTAKVLFLEYEITKNGRIVDTKKVYLDDFVKKFKIDSSLAPNPIGNAVNSVINEMDNVFVEKDELLRTQAAIPIYFLLFRQALKQGLLKNISRNKLLEFRKLVKDNRERAETDMTSADFSMLEYDRLSIQGTNDASSIKERLRIISKFFKINNFDFS